MLTEIPPAVSGPRDLPAVGQLHRFQHDPLGFLLRMQREHGDLVHYHLGGTPVWQLNHPDLIAEVLLKRHAEMHKDAITQRLATLGGRGLVTSEGDHWRQQRRLAAPAFSRRNVEAYAETMTDAAVRALPTLAAGRVVDVYEAMSAVTRDIALRTLFGADLAGDGEAAAACIDVFMAGFVSEAQGFHRLLPSAVPTPSRLKVWRAVRTLDRIVQDLIQRRRARPAGPDLLWRLLRATDDADAAMDDTQLRDEVVTLFVAGHETTALGLTYALHLIAGHPWVRRTLHGELDAVLGRRRPTAADLPHLEYTTAIVREALRLYPPAWGIGREPFADLTFRGHTVRAGTEFLIAPWVLHRDPRWFERPDVFHPERWMDGLHRRLPRFAYLPFGGGPRVCIGSHFALLEMVMVLATLCQDRSFYRAEHGPLRLVPSVTLRPAEPVHMRLTSRV